MPEQASCWPQCAGTCTSAMRSKLRRGDDDRPRGIEDGSPSIDGLRPSVLEPQRQVTGRPDNGSPPAPGGSCHVPAARLIESLGSRQMGCCFGTASCCVLPVLFRMDIHPSTTRTSRQIGTAVYMQGLTGDKPSILRRQKHRRSSNLVRLRHPSEWDRARHLDD